MAEKHPLHLDRGAKTDKSEKESQAAEGAIPNATLDA